MQAITDAAIFDILMCGILWFMCVSPVTSGNLFLLLGNPWSLRSSYWQSREIAGIPAKLLEIIGKIKVPEMIAIKDLPFSQENRLTLGTRGNLSGFW